MGMTEEQIREMIIKIFGKPREEDKCRATVSICKDKERVATATGTLKEISESLPDVPDGYYLLEYYKDYAYQEIVSEKHFGCRCRKRGGLNITESVYCNWITNKMIEQAKKGGYVESFATVAYWSLVVSSRLEYARDIDSFYKWSIDFFENDKWQKVVDLNEQIYRSGVYAMLLDKYGLCYIGQAEDIKKRIMAHWSVDRLGTTGINLFRAKDTTRIYVINTNKMNSVEYKAVSQIPVENRLNILHGGTIDYHNKTGNPLFFGDHDNRNPWSLTYGEFQSFEDQYYDKYVVETR